MTISKQGSGPKALTVKAASADEPGSLMLTTTPGPYEVSGSFVPIDR